MVDVYEGDAGQVNGLFSWRTLWGDPRFAIAMIKANQGTGYVPDKWFGLNWNAIAASQPVGAARIRACYSYFETQQSVIAQADTLLQMVARAGGFMAGDLVPMLDVEGATNPDKDTQLADQLATWSAYITKELGVPPILYGNQYLWSNNITSTLGFGGLVIARYSDGLPPAVYERIGWKIAPTIPSVLGWQLAGTDGPSRVPGYPGSAPIGAGGKLIESDITAIIMGGGGEAGLQMVRDHFLIR